MTARIDKPIADVQLAMTHLQVSLTAFGASDNTLLVHTTVSVPRDATYKKFCKKLRKAVGVSGKYISEMKYVDEENDEISLVNDADLSIAYRVAGQSGSLAVRMFIDNKEATSDQAEESEGEVTPKEEETAQDDASKAPITVGDRTKLCRKVEKKVRRLRALLRREDGLKGEIRSILDELESKRAAEEELPRRIEEATKQETTVVLQSVATSNQVTTIEQPATTMKEVQDAAASASAVDGGQSAASTSTGSTNSFWYRVIDTEEALVDAVSERLITQLAIKKLQAEADGERKSCKSTACPSKGQPLQFGTLCNACGQLVTGMLYRCVMCKFYNLCEQCESQEKWFAHAEGKHLFVKVRRPMSVRQTAVLTTKLPLLDSAFYTEESAIGDRVSPSRGQLVHFCDDEVVNVKLNERELMTFRWIEQKRAKCVAKIECGRKLSDRLVESFDKRIRERRVDAARKSDGTYTFFDKHANGTVEECDELKKLACKMARAFLKEEKRRIKFAELFARVSAKLEGRVVPTETFDLRTAISELRKHYANKLARRERKQSPGVASKRVTNNAKQIDILRELVRRCDVQLQLLGADASSQELPVVSPLEPLQRDLIEFNQALHIEDSDILRVSLRRYDLLTLCGKLDRYGKKLAKRMRKMNCLRDRLENQSKIATTLFHRALTLHERLTEAGQRSLEDAGLQSGLDRARLLAQLELVNGKSTTTQQVIENINVKLAKTTRKITRLQSKMAGVAKELDVRNNERINVAPDAEADARVAQWREAKREVKLRTLVLKLDTVAKQLRGHENDSVQQLRCVAKLRKLEAKVERKRRGLAGQPSQSTAPLYASRFVEDANMSDGELVAPGATFTKSWRVVNCGIATWHAESVQLVCIDSVSSFDDSLAILCCNPVDATLPGSETVLSVQLRAPLQIGAVSSKWQLRSKDGCFGNYLRCQVEVFGDAERPAPSKCAEAEQTSSLRLSCLSASLNDSRLETQAIARQDANGMPASSTISRHGSVTSLASSASWDDEFVQLPVPVPECFDTSEAERRMLQLSLSRSFNAGTSMLSQSVNNESTEAACTRSVISPQPHSFAGSSCSHHPLRDEDFNEASFRSAPEKRTHSQAFDSESEQLTGFRFEPLTPHDTSLATPNDPDAMSDYQVISSRSQSISDVELIDRHGSDNDDSDSETETDECEMDAYQLQVPRGTEVELVNLSSRLAATRLETVGTDIAAPQVDAESNQQDDAAVPTTPVENASTSQSFDKPDSVKQQHGDLSKWAQKALSLAELAASTAYDVYTSMQARERVAAASQSQAQAHASPSTTNAISITPISSANAKELDPNTESVATVAREPSTSPLPAQTVAVNTNPIPVPVAPRALPAFSAWRPTRPDVPPAVTSSNSFWDPPTQWTPPAPAPLPRTITEPPQLPAANDQLAKLSEMGFTDMQRNEELLRRLNGNVEAVISELVDYEDSDWYIHRH